LSALTFDEDSLNSNIKSLTTEIATTADRVAHLKDTLTQTYETLGDIRQAAKKGEDKTNQDKKIVETWINVTGLIDTTRLASTEKLAEELKPRLGVTSGAGDETASKGVLDTLQKIKLTLGQNAGKMRRETLERLTSLEADLRVGPSILAERLMNRRVSKELNEAPEKLADELKEETKGFKR